jgi:hypothetical protein
MAKAHKSDAVKLERRPQRRAAAPVEVAQVHPDALALAVELAKGDIRRIQVVDARTVLVRNKTRGR